MKDQINIRLNGETSAVINDQVEVSAQLDHENLTLKREYRGRKIEYHYRLLRYPGDRLANWISLERAESYVGSPAIKKAKLLINDNILIIKGRLIVGQEHPLYTRMAAMVDSKLRHYKSDFTYHDTLSLAADPKDFIWMLRETGTWLISGKCKGGDQLITYKEDHDFYHVKDGKISPVTRDDALQIYESWPAADPEADTRSW